MTYTIRDGVQWLQKRIPMESAASWDNTGLLLGDPVSPLRRIGTCLTVTAQTAFEAIQRGADLLIAHHPLLFRGAKSLLANRPQDQVILDLIRAQVAVFSPHTAWDNAPGGINDQLAHLAGIGAAGPLRLAPAKKNRFKIVVFVPAEVRTKVAQAMFGAGAGVIGNYRECSFRLAGTGTFFGTDAADPVLGQKGRLEEVTEERLELICSAPALPAAIEALRKSHPYEEPAFDIYPLEADPGQATGEGRVGLRDEEIDLGTLAGNLARSLGTPFVQIVGSPSRKGRKIALACGAAGEFLTDAIAAGADFFITGELRYHDALTAEAAGVGVVVLGHHASEQFAMASLGVEMAQALPGLIHGACDHEVDPMMTWPAQREG